MCIFTDDSWVVGYQDLYQVCSCGKHVWSVKSKKSLKFQKYGLYLLTDQAGVRSLVYVKTPQLQLTQTCHEGIACVFLFFAVFIAIYCYFYVALV